MTPPPARPRDWLALGVLALPTLLVSIDVSVMLLALPHISGGLGASSTEQLWIMDMYGFMLAGFMITMGNLGDRNGRRKLLMIDATGFGVASALVAFSSTPLVLIAALKERSSAKSRRTRTHVTGRLPGRSLWGHELDPRRRRIVGLHYADHRRGRHRNLRSDYLSDDASVLADRRWRPERRPARHPSQSVDENGHQVGLFPNAASRSVGRLRRRYPDSR
jgi:hypothetical protein